MTGQPTVIDRGVAVMDPNHSTSGIPNTLAIGADGSISSGGVASGTMTPTQVTVPATANGILILAANASRVGAQIATGSVAVYIQQGATGVTTINGFAIPANTIYTLNSPRYTGAIYGIVASGTSVVSVMEYT